MDDSSEPFKKIAIWDILRLSLALDQHILTHYGIALGKMDMIYIYMINHFSGDCDYFRNIQGALQRKWNVEIWAWHSNCSDGGTGTNEVSLFLYFRNREGMLYAQQWIQQKHPGIRIKKRIRELGRRSIF
uniref:Uncharacterized protein n=1 Tax=Rhizophagus irregularis (strain DAOM 181602 / DAOM 197198 / MUCL 43194) TaxID=747089 RepID=U9UJR9_RHIID